jgi:hypothetical protein
MTWLHQVYSRSVLHDGLQSHPDTNGQKYEALYLDVTGYSAGVASDEGLPLL